MNTLPNAIFHVYTDKCQGFWKWWHHLNGHTSVTMDRGHRNVKTNPSALRALRTQQRLRYHLFPPPTHWQWWWVCYCLCLLCGDIVSLVGSELITEYTHNHTFIRLIKCNLLGDSMTLALAPPTARVGAKSLPFWEQRSGESWRRMQRDKLWQWETISIVLCTEERPPYDEEEDPGDVTGTLRKRGDVNIPHDKCHCITNITCHGNASHHIPLCVTIAVSSSLWWRICHKT